MYRIKSSILLFWAIGMLHQTVVPNAVASVDWRCTSNSDCTAVDSMCVNNKCQCPEEHVWSSDMTSCLKVAKAYGEACVENIQCSTHLLIGGQCIKNICVCGPNYYYLHGRCNSYSGLFEQCQKDDDCYVNADFEASTCVSGVCRCSPGFYQREYRTCRRSSKDFDAPCIVNADCNFSKDAYCNNRLVCAQKEVKGKRALNLFISSSNYFNEVYTAGVAVGAPCKSNADCKSLRHSECSSSGECVCKRAHFPSASNEDCVPELGEPCDIDDTVFIKKSICRNGIWACTEPLVASANRQLCKKVSKKIGESCQSDEQCFALGPDAYCDVTKCACNEKSHFVESEEFCWISTGYGEDCQSNLDCHIPGFRSNLTCADKICSCPSGTKLHSNGMECIHSSAGIGMKCEEDMNCAVENSICIDNVCSCNENYFEMNNQCLAGIGATCVSNEDCAAEKSMCLEGKCTCQEKYVAESIKTCLRVASFGGPCITDIQCTAETPDSICLLTNSTEKAMNDIITTSGTCICKTGYYYKSGRCNLMRVLGETCKTLDDCYLASNSELAVCMNGRCECTWGYVPENSVFCVRGGSALAFNSNSASTISGQLVQSFLVTMAIVFLQLLRLVPSIS